MFNLKSAHSFSTVILSVFIVLLLPTLLFAFQNEPDGFRGIKWGTNIKELSDMVKIYDQSYIKKNDKMKIGDADLRRINYWFYKGRFFAVVIKFKGSSNFHRIKETFFQLYGEAKQPNEFLEDYYWDGVWVYIRLDYGQILQNGEIHYYFWPIERERQADEKEKAKKGSEDL